MNIEQALKQAKEKNVSAKLKFLAGQPNRPVSVNGILQHLKDQIILNNYGDLAPITKDTRNKIHGFIKFLKNNGLEDKEIYEFLTKCVENWDFLQNIKIHTDNRKKYNLDTRPNILDIINCKTQLFQELNNKIEESNEEDIDFLAEWGKL
jgi:hypothetical protein